MDRALDLLSIDFSLIRGKAELEVVRAMLSDTSLGQSIASAIGLGPEHFGIHGDARYAFCACEVAGHLGRDVVLRLARRALEIERFPFAEGLNEFAAPWAGANTAFLTVFIFVVGRRLIRMHAAERAARDYIRHAEKILRTGLQG